MSHFTVMVIGDNWEQQLEKYDENIEMPSYISYTKEQLIAKEKQFIEEYKEGTYAEYLEDPALYIALHKNNEGHIKYVSTEFPVFMNLDDEALWEHIMKRYEEDDRMDSSGNLWSTYNPNSKWDWYQMGGRWSGMLKVREGAEAEVGSAGVFGRDPEATGYDQAEKGDILNFPELKTYALVKDGVWYEKGEMGWWGMSSNEMNQEEWDAKVDELLADLDDDTMITMVDCHI